MVMLAPGGTARLTSLHEPLWHAGAYRALFARLIPTYIVALVPGLIALVALILMIEMTYRLMVKAGEGTATTFFSVPVDVASPVAWTVAAVLFVGGILLLRRALPVVADAWQRS